GKAPGGSSRVESEPGPLVGSSSARARTSFPQPLAANSPRLVARLATRGRGSGWDYPSAAASLMEGLEECFTINRLDVPPSLHRCLATTNLIESPHSGVRLRTRRVCRWRDGTMVKRWMASAFLATEKNFRKMMGYRDLWTLEAILNGSKSATRQAVA